MTFRAGPSRPTSGRISVAGFDAPVKITTDAAGVPTVVASSRADIYRAQGFLHMAERGWQMDFDARTALGSLAELVGPGALMSDAFFARLGFAQLARSNVERAPDEVRQVFDWYAEGMRAGRVCVPTTAEHGLLGAQPPELDGPQAHLRATAMMLALGFTLQRDWLLTLIRAAVEAGADPADRPGDEPSAAELLAAIHRQSGAAGGTSAGWGSNAWAVSRPGAAPLLCGDPHLDARLPGHWYPMHLRGPDGDVAGAGRPGLPDLFFGHNGHIAWATTFAPALTTRLVLERLSRDGANVLRAGGGRVPVNRQRQRIGVRGFGEDIVVCGQTENGRLLGLNVPGRDGRWVYDLAIESVLWREPYNQPVLAGVATAKTLADLTRAFSGWRSVPQTVVCADRSGAIARIEIGARLTPTGTTALRGWTLDGRVDLETENRLRVVPAMGAVVAANNRPDGPDEPGHWEAPFRAGRIRELLATGPANAARMAGIQLDVYSNLAEEILGDLLAGVGDTQGEPAILARLREWDRFMHSDAAEPLVFVLWLSDLACSAVVADDAGNQVAEAFVTTKAWLTEWGWPLVAAHVRSRTPQELIASLDRALASVRATQGDQIRTWSWGRHHAVAAHHGLERLLPADLLPAPEPMPGADDTVCRGDAMSPPRATTSFRMIIDLEVPDKSLWSFPSGVSGVIGAKHFLDQDPLWRDGRYHPLPWTEPACRIRTVSELFLSPR